MKKVIIVDSCADCPYMAFYRRKKDYICVITNKNITKFIDKKEIDPECKLDDAVIEKCVFNNSSTIISEGVAICKALPQNDSFNYYSVGEERQFSRQIDGNIRIYHTGYESQKFTLFPMSEFDKYFKIVKEQSVQTTKNEICPDCKRPLRWCECL